MRSRDVVGKKIVQVVQDRFYLDGGRDPVVAVSYLVLEDGTELHPYTIETEGDYLHGITVVKRRKRRGNPEGSV